MITCNHCEREFDTERGLRSHISKKHGDKKQIAWNRGLTKETSEKVADISKKCSIAAQAKRSIKHCKISLCENCGNEHTGSFASGRFCSLSCSRSFTTKHNRKEISKRASETHILNHRNKVLNEMNSTSYEQLSNFVQQSSSLKELAFLLGLNAEKRSIIQSLQKKCALLDINIDHLWLPRKDLKKRLDRAFRIFSSKNEKGYSLYPWALEQIGRKKECEMCGLQEIWNNKKLVLQIDHKDGNSLNNLADNLRYLCPNCHSQTETFGYKNSTKFKMK